MKIRLHTYKSFRHYGGREITAYNHTCEAKLIEKQRDGTYYVELLTDCANFKKGHKIAVLSIDFDVK